MASPVLAIILHVVGLILVLIDFFLWVITLGPLTMIYKKLTARSTFAAPVKEEPINVGYEAQADLPPSKVWRSVEAIADGGFCTSTDPTCSTAWELLAKAAETYPQRKAQGSRPFLGPKFVEDGDKFPAKHLGPAEWRTYEEMHTLAKDFGCGLRALGAQPQPGKLTEDHNGVLMYDDTCAEWMICAQGAMSQDICVATCYATLGIDSVETGVNQGGCTVVVCNRKSVAQLGAMAKKMPTLKAIVYLDTFVPVEEARNKLVLDKSACTIPYMSFADVVKLGQDKPCPVNPPKPSSIAVLMYTSGSTGAPKGVMVLQSNLCAVIAGVNKQLPPSITEGTDEVYLGYLPLAHILELVAEFYYLSSGHAVGYADPKTLLAGAGRAYPTGALETFKPTLMAGVPKVWETIKAGAEVKIKKSGPVGTFLVSLAIKMKARAKKNYMYTPLFNVLLKKFKNTVGGRLKICLSGGGAISSAVQEWVRTALDCPLVQGYGLTETCAAATIQKYDDLSLGIAGTPVSSIEMTLHSEPDITDNDGKPYLSTDTVHSNGEACAGRGEVWLRGPGVTAGYYKLPDKTAEEFGTGAGHNWFQTGDIGMLTPGGALKIIDRKKNLVKLKGGEYVALEKMNTTYNTSTLVDPEAGGVCCYAGSELDRPVALAQIKKESILAIGEELGKSSGDINALCSDPDVRAKVLAEFNAVGKKAGLQRNELLAGVYPTTKEWSPSNGCLTATSKLVPKTVWKTEKDLLDVLKKEGTR